MRDKAQSARVRDSILWGTEERAKDDSPALVVLDKTIEHGGCVRELYIGLLVRHLTTNFLLTTLKKGMVALPNRTVRSSSYLKY